MNTSFGRIKGSTEEGMKFIKDGTKLRCSARHF
jgi:hypothetical protein